MGNKRTGNLLNKAADVMQRRGRTIGRLQDDDGQVCVLGALGSAAYNDPWRMDGDVRRAAEAMKDAVVTGGREVWQFNDSTRDDGKVIRAMREAADRELADDEVKQRAANDPLGVGTGPW